MCMCAFIDDPLVQNPLILNPNASSILLKWSPPFLWPGLSINYYNISINIPVKNEVFYDVNATFSDVVVSFLKVSDNTTETQSCNEMLFSISAITYNGTDSELPSFNVVGGYIQSKTIIYIQ